MLLLQGTSEQALMKLINDSNTLPVPLEVGDLYYGNPRSAAGGFTILPTVTQYDNEEYEGYATFEYKRLNLSLIFKDIRPIVTAIGENSLVRLLPVINKKTGLNLQPSDIIDQSIVWLGGNEQANLQFVISDKSLGYEGRLIVQFIRIRPRLVDMITDNALSVLKFYDPVAAGKRSLAMETWGIDFSEDQGDLSLYFTSWRYPEKVVELMARNGFPNYPAGFLGDPSQKIYLFATKDVPKANQAFSHVIIHKSVNADTYNGDAYFHFNRS